MMPSRHAVTSAVAPKLAFVVHLFHQDQWPDFAAVLARCRYPFSLFVTLPPDGDAAVQVLSLYPQAEIHVVPNVGRDVAPFLALLGRLQSFDLVCKLHTKRKEGPHSVWRAALLDGLAGSAGVIHAYVSAFMADEDVVLAGPKLLYLDGHSHQMGNATALHLMHGPLPDRWGFFAGTMFWCRPQLFAGLDDLYPHDIFLPHTDTDAQPEHVIERAFGLLAAQADRKVFLLDGSGQVEHARRFAGAVDWRSIYLEFEELAA